MKIEQHAIKRAVERFGVEENVAANWMRREFSKAKFVANTVDSYGIRGKLYSTDGIVFATDLRGERIKTVYPATPSHREIKHKIDELLAKELRKLHRRERAQERKYRLAKTELELEKAELYYRVERTRSEAVKLACQARINAINERLREYYEETRAVKDEKHWTAKTVMAYA